MKEEEIYGGPILTSLGLLPLLLLPPPRSHCELDTFGKRNKGFTLTFVCRLADVETELTLDGDKEVSVSDDGGASCCYHN